MIRLTLPEAIVVTLIAITTATAIVIYLIGVNQ